MTRYHKFTDILKESGEYLIASPPKVPRAPKAPKVDASDGTPIPTLGALGTLGGPLARSSASPEPPPPGGRWKMLVQLWNIEKARDLVDRLIAAAGPHRMAGLDQQFEKMRTRFKWSGARKIEWLEELCENFAANPYYWPADRPDRTTAGCERHNKAIIAIERNGGRKLLQHDVVRNHGESDDGARQLVEVARCGLSDVRVAGAGQEISDELVVLLPRCHR